MPRFHYHASAIGAAGSLRAPWSELIPSQASAALPETGGLAIATAAHFEDRRVLQFRHSHCRLIGRFDERTKMHETEATVVVEGLNILDMITADRITGRLVTTHPEDDPEAETAVTTTGSHFENLRIAGQLVEIDLANDVFARYPTYAEIKTVVCETPQSPTGKEEDIRIHAEAQQFMVSQQSPEEREAASSRMAFYLPADPPDREFRSNKRVITTSLVRSLRGIRYPVKRCGHVIEIDGFGIIRLAELHISRSRKQLIMVQANLGSPVQADLICGSVEGNGDHW